MIGLVLGTILASSTVGGSAFKVVTDNGTLPAAVVSRIDAKWMPSLDPAAPHDVSLHRVTYPSRDAAGMVRQLTGLVALPVGGAPRGLVIYYHSTTAMKEMVPSRYTANGGPLEGELTVAAFASAGYAVAAPDYLGLGDDSGIHPYALPSINVNSGIDMIAATRQLGLDRQAPIGEALYVTGFSEGGAVAMWTARALADRTEPGFRLTAAAPISGAYDVTGTEITSILTGQSNIKWLAARFYFAGYLGLALSSIDPTIQLKDFFSPSFASYIPFAFAHGTNDYDIIRRLAIKGFQLGALRTIKRSLQAKFVKALEGRDMSNPLVARLAAENCFDWAPKAPLCLISLERDFLVPAENARVAIAAMRSRGAGAGVACRVLIKGTRLDHISFAPTGLSLARRFFDGGFAAVPTVNE